MSIQRFHTGKRLSEMVIHGNTIYLAGQVAENAVPDVKDQTRQVLASIEKLLSEAGSKKENILSATIYITDMRNFPAMNEVWDAWVAKGHQPARATVQASLATPELLVEIQIVAAK